MSFIGIEEIFLQVEDMQKALDFYHGVLGIPVDKQDAERTYLQTERGHVVLQIRNHTGRHRGGRAAALRVHGHRGDLRRGPRPARGRHLVHARTLRGARRRAGALHDRSRRQRDRGQHPLPVRQAQALIGAPRPAERVRCRSNPGPSWLVIDNRRQCRPGRRYQDRLFGQSPRHPEARRGG